MTITLIGVGFILGMYIVTQISEHIENNIRHRKFQNNLNNFNPDPELLSECCGYKIMEGTDLCSKCKEHTGQHNN